MMVPLGEKMTTAAVAAAAVAMLLHLLAVMLLHLLALAPVATDPAKYTACSVLFSSATSNTNESTRRDNTCRMSCRIVSVVLLRLAPLNSMPADPRSLRIRLCHRQLFDVAHQ